MGWALSPDLLTGRWHLLSIGQTGDSSPTQCSLLQDATYNGIPIYWDKHGMPFLPGIGRGQCLLGILVLPASQTKVKNARAYLPRARANARDEDNVCPGTLQGYPQRSSWVSVAYTKAHSVSPHEGSGPSTCQSWGFHDLHLREERTFLQDRWPLPISLIPTSDPIRVGHHIGEPLSTMTAVHQTSGNPTTIICRAEHANPWKDGLQWPTTENWGPGTPDNQHEHYTVTMQTLLICMQGQGTQASKYTIPLPVWQPWKTYWAKDLSLGHISLWYEWLSVVPEIWMSLLLLVGLLAFSNLTVVFPCTTCC